MSARQAAEKSFREGLVCLEIEGTGLTEDNQAMFRMFDEQGWNESRRLDYLRWKFAQPGEEPLAAE